MPAENRLRATRKSLPATTVRKSHKLRTSGAFAVSQTVALPSHPPEPSQKARPNRITGLNHRSSRWREAAPKTRPNQFIARELNAPRGA